MTTVSDGSIDELIRKLQAAKFVAEHNGEVCPMNWKPGQKTLKKGLDLGGQDLVPRRSARSTPARSARQALGVFHFMVKFALCPAGKDGTSLEVVCQCSLSRAVFSVSACL